ncbi:ABC transporter ATP-binding protein [Vibrio nigripulchritudo]|uniref:ABC transporter ATP-binding protein n=1 Tax=Vibrio nigripulchritudo TaxID=28173 RepID=UPI00190BB028|nr:ATP-binding cassette domain-containing protein [Vibrio nigripulchritudo]
MAGVSKGEIKTKVDAVSKILNIDSYLDRKPHELSGGQRQRVAIGRAIAREPEIMLFDEPLSNLDAKLRVVMRIELRKLHDRTGATSIFVTHDQVEAMTLADRIIIMNKGVVEQIGTPQEIYHQPATTFVAGFIGSPPMNLLERDFIDIDDVIREKICVMHQSPFAKVIGIRPEDIVIRDSDGVPCVIDLVEDLGANKLVYCKLGGFQITCSVSSERDIKPGDRKNLQFDLNKFNFFDESGKRIN